MQGLSEAWPYLEQDAEVFRSEHVLIEDQPAPCNLPTALDPPKQVLAGADIEVLLGFPAAAIHDVVAAHLDFPVDIARLDVG